MKELVLVTAVMAALCPTAEAQQPDHIAGHLALVLYPEGHPHVGGAVSWRKNIARNWGLNAGYIITTSTDPYRHFDNVAWVGVERSFGPPDASVPYILLGSVGGIYHTVTRTSNRGLFALPGIGFGIRDWSPDRTWFVAPEVQFLMTSLLTLNVTFGFGL